MSAYLVDQETISLLVSAAVKFDEYDTLPQPNWSALAERFPAAFAGVVDPEGRIRSHTIGRGWRHHCADELGRAMWLANADSICARYPSTDAQPGDGRTRYPEMWPEGDYAAIRAYRHSTQPGDILAAIKAGRSLDYQACEVSDYEKSWLSEFLRKLEYLLVGCVLKQTEPKA
jgi:hypothetical protein